jgi:mannose-1-phosphate guanylyltransferase
VKNAEKYLGETFLVSNGDIFTDLDITAMIDFHRKSKAKITISLAPVDDPTSYGLIETDDEGRITRFLEKPKRSEVLQSRTNMINAGTYIMEPDVLAQMPPETMVSFEREVFPQLLARGEPLYAYSSPAYWIDMGTPERYLQLHRDLLSGKCKPYALSPGEEVLIGEQCDIHPTVQIKGAVVMGAKCSIGRRVKLTGAVVIGSGCTVLDDTVIKDSIVWNNVRLGPQTKLICSIVADHCCLNARSIIENSVLGDNVTVVSDCKMEPGSRIWPGTTVEGKRD